ncbi:MAG: hypothetical protein ACK4FJ_18495 [Ferrovibrio sp.]|uniref:hypothetical protein n=1 Tax=Ferrovibrio sp. TaxID=1917215 RepID=UPI00391DB3FB
MQKIVSEHTIGLNREKPRLWLDGKRLIHAGFIGGTIYGYTVKPGKIVMRLDADAPRHGERKVTGRPDGKPIIDMLGRDLIAAGFKAGDRVRVTYQPGSITVVPAE